MFGQDNAISIFASGYFQSELRKITDKTSRKPKATYLFAGPPGVGKTFLAEQAAEILDLPFMRFDMSEFSERESIMELVGTNKSFKGDKEGSLTGFVENNPNCVLLFDEIEKANIAVIHLFLQVLDAGRLRDTNSAKEVDFSQTVIIFTTNAGIDGRCPISVVRILNYIVNRMRLEAIFPSLKICVVILDNLLVTRKAIRLKSGYQK